MPFYCPECSKFVVFVKDKQKDVHFVLSGMEYPWEIHSCSKNEFKTYYKNKIFEQLNTKAYQSDLLMHFPPTKNQYEGRKKFYTGIILSFDTEDEKKTMQVLVEGGRILEVNARFSYNKLTGMLIDLQSLKRHVNGKYRLGVLKPIVLKVPPPRKSNLEYYQLIFKGKEQEQLETCTEQVIKVIHHNNGNILGTQPLPVKIQNGNLIFGRLITLYSQESLLALFQDLTFPLTIDLSICQRR